MQSLPIPRIRDHLSKIPSENSSDAFETFHNASLWYKNSTVRLVSHDPASRNFFHFVLMKESRYSNNRHTIVTVLPPNGR